MLYFPNSTYYLHRTKCDGKKQDECKEALSCRCYRRYVGIGQWAGCCHNVVIATMLIMFP